MPFLWVILIGWPMCIAGSNKLCQETLAYFPWPHPCPRPSRDTQRYDVLGPFDIDVLMLTFPRALAPDYWVGGGTVNREHISPHPY